MRWEVPTSLKVTKFETHIMNRHNSSSKIIEMKVNQALNADKPYQNSAKTPQFHIKPANQNQKNPPNHNQSHSQLQKP